MKTFVRLVSVCALVVVVSSRAGAQGVCTGVTPAPNTTLARVPVVTGLTSGTSGPLFVTAPPGDTGRIMVVLQNGVIRQIARGALPTASTVFLDISARVNHTGDEQGLLGLAFSPTFATDGLFYVDYVRLDGDTIVSQFRTLDGTPGTNGDPASEKQLFRVHDTENNHQGGWMSFGPDGYLYISQGDGGGSGDVHGTCGNGQNMGALLGKLLRIDPTGTTGNLPDCGLDPGTYRIPATNPLADGAGGNCDEIFAYGLRNPWRDSFDTVTGDIYLGDVGQGCWEEVDLLPTGTSGQNFGWRNFEGLHCFNATQGCTATNSPAGCPNACSDPAPSGDPLPNGTTLPIYNYSSSVNPECAITGGYVYRGCRMPNFRGKYFYGDYCAGTILSFLPNGGVPNTFESWTSQVGSGLTNSLTSFGTDAQGELYFCDRKGTVYMLLPPITDTEVSGDGAAVQFRLDKTGAWTWEDINYAYRQPVTSYHVYRANIADDVFNAGEVFDCIHQSTTPSWPSGGDLTVPSAGTWYAYVVTALNGASQTSPGGTPTRTLSAVACP